MKSWIVKEKKRTPLHTAVETKSIGMVEILLSKGADINAIDIFIYWKIHL